ncbi:hypothetical protein GOV04_05320 [Candidatus Woesearchaeota archaeon]|nr:hypothetical protein [Candidatus Woesearchaeota archaeon]
MKLIGVPFGGGTLSKNEGCQNMPSVIVEELDVEILQVDNFNVEVSFDVIEQKIALIDEPVMLIGGDHSITYPAFKGLKHNHDSVGFIVFDAHPDLQSDFSPPTHEDYLRALIDEGELDPENVLLIGARNISDEEQEYLEAKKIRTLSVSEAVKEQIEQFAKNYEILYVSIDIDVIDPSLAPGTGHLEPNGFSKVKFFELIEPLIGRAAIIDLVEINPEKDVDGKTVSLGIEIIKKFCF